MGCGKTTMGKILADKLGWQFTDMDVFIEGRYHQTISQIFAEKGEDEFRKIEKQCLHELGEYENVIIATGGGAPCFFDNMEYMTQQGDTIYIQMSPQQLAGRLLSTKAGVRPLIAKLTPEELPVFIADALQRREPYYLQANTIITGTDEELEQWFREYSIR
jgi:shikimate kinase